MKIIVEFDLSASLRRLVSSLFEAVALHSHSIDGINRAIEDVQSTQERMIRLMTEETRKIIKAFDDATNRLAGELESLKAKAAEQGSLSENEITTALTPILSRLQTLGSDERNPVPETGSGGGAAPETGEQPA